MMTKEGRSDVHPGGALFDLRLCALDIYTNFTAKCLFCARTSYRGTGTKTTIKARAHRIPVQFCCKFVWNFNACMYMRVYICVKILCNFIVHWMDTRPLKQR